MESDNLHKKNILWPIGGLALLFVVGWLVFGETLQADFINWDDPDWITQNCTIQSPSLETLVWVFVPNTHKYYQPVTYASWMLDTSIDGLNPFYFHLQNLFWYLLGCGLAFLFLKKLFDATDTFSPSRRWPLALAASLLFLLHPGHVESLAWATERKDLLTLALGFASLLTSLHVAVHTERSPWRLRSWWWTLVLFLLMILSKGYAAVFAAVYLLLELGVQRARGRFDLRRLFYHIPFFVLFIASVAFYYSINTALSSIQQSFEQYTFGQRVALWFSFMGDYFLTSLLPFDIHYIWIYREEMLVWGARHGFALFVCLASPIFAVLAWRKKWIAGLFLFALAAIYLMPGSSIVPLNWASRYLLFPLLFLCFGWVVLANKLLDTWPEKGGNLAALLLFLIVLGAYATESKSRVPVWKNELAFRMDAFRQHRDADSQVLITAETLLKYNPALGLKLLTPMLENSENRKFTNVRLAEINLVRGAAGPEKAIAVAEAALKEARVPEPIANNIAYYYMELGNPEKAAEWLEFSVRNKPSTDATRTRTSFWLIWVQNAIEREDYPTALQLLDRLPHQSGRTTATVLRILAEAGANADWEGAIQKLENGPWPDAARPVVLQALVRLHEKQGNSSKAQQLLQESEKRNQDEMFHRCWFGAL